jgi:hypothetical protein
LYNLAPEESSTFSLSIYEDLPEADNIVAAIVGNSVAELQRLNLTVTNMSLIVDDSGDFHLVGELLNETDFPVIINGLAGATFDSQGEILTANSYSALTRYLDPGESTPFRITMIGPSEGAADVADYQLYLDVEASEEEPVFALAFSDAYAYLDTIGGFHLVGEVTNEEELGLNLRLVAGIYDEDGAVLDAASLDLPVSSLLPGESIPYDFDFWGPMSYQTGLFDERADQYSIQVDPYWSWESDAEIVTLSTKDDTQEFRDYVAEFRGTVVNDSDGLVSSVVVLLVVRDSTSGEVIATDYDILFDELAAGESAMYTIYLDTPTDFDPNTAEFEIIPKGERP